MSDESVPCEPLKLKGDLIDLGRLRGKFVRKFRVIPDIHSADFIFRFFYEELYRGQLEEALNQYYWLGRVSAEKVAELISTFLRRPRHSAISLLDFASGYGSVARHIHKFLYSVDLTAMDVHEQAQRFNQDRLRVRTLLSTSDPAAIQPHGKYDVVFALSFLSHMPRRTFLPWLVKLSEFVKDDGLLIFTTHGRVSHRLMPQINVESDGFGFTAFSEQRDLSVEDYGLTVTYHEFVIGELLKLEGFELLLFQQAHWWGHQDCWVLLKAQRNCQRVTPSKPPSFLRRILNAWKPLPRARRRWPAPVC